MERLEFNISPSGLVTEKVSGVKGQACRVITDAINAQLGSVVSEEQTEEMFEVEITEEQTVRDGGGGSW
jgi:hypothetical protein